MCQCEQVVELLTEIRDLLAHPSSAPAEDTPIEVRGD